MKKRNKVKQERAVPPPVPPVPAVTTTDRPVTRNEVLLVGAIVAAGVLIRLSFLSLLAIEHFDEGVYASNLWFDEEYNFRYPMRHLYAPPLVPALIESTLAIAGTSLGWIPMIPSLIAGCLTPLVAWRIARDWFTPAAAIAAASLFAFNDVHVMFSRAALTDGLLLLLVMTAVWLFERAVKTGFPSVFLIAGVVTSVAWWTKYNGWLPLLIAAIAIACRGLFKELRGEFWGTAAKWLMAVMLAGLLWSPYLFSLRKVGGYARVAENHQHYIAGFSGWLESLSHQLANLQYVEGPLGGAGWFFAVLAVWAVSPTSVHRRVSGRVAVVLAAVVAGGLATWLGASVLAVLVGGFFLGLKFVQRIRRPTESEPFPWFLAVWFVLLLIMTPLYSPYLRLVLPLMGSAWLASGFAVAGLIEALEKQFAASGDSSAAASKPITWSVAVTAAVIAAVAIAVFAIRDLPLNWRNDRTSLRVIARKIQTKMTQDEDVQRHEEHARVMYVFAEPGLFYHLQSEGEILTRPASKVDVVPIQVGEQTVATFFSFGLHASRDAKFRAKFEEVDERFELVESYRYRPSVMVLLDHFDPRSTEFKEATAEVRLYRVR